MHILFVIALALTVGCAERAAKPRPLQPSAPAAFHDAASASAASPMAPPRDPPASSVRAAITGVLMHRGRDVEICPGTGFGPCAGIAVTGKVDDAWLSQPNKISVWRIVGDFDGTSLLPNGGAQPTTFASQPDYRNPCPEFQRPAPGVNPGERLTSDAKAFVRKHANRVAGQWWDRERQTMVVWLTGEVAELQKALRARAPGKRVCLKGQARFSEQELQSARLRADRILSESGAELSGSSLDVVGNRAVYYAEAIDAPTRARLDREVGEAVRVIAFIELLQHRLEQMPLPAASGDVRLVTSKTRSNEGMAALGRFTLQYDASLVCFYLQDAQGQRLLPVWPFGFWATSNPLEVLDYDGNVVAKAGSTIELGGGEVDIQHVRSANACGAKISWIGRPHNAFPAPN